MRSLPTTFMQKKRHNIWILLMSLALFLLAAVLSLLLGSAAFSPAELWKAAAGGADAAVLRIFLHVRLPRTLAVSGTYILAGIPLAFSLHCEMDLLSLGDDTAKSLGLRVGKFRFLLLLTASVLAGAAVSFAGLLGFAGLIVPHGARFFVGSESRWLLPVSALSGAAFVCVCDVLARILFAPFELPVGIVVSFLGGPFFLYLLIRRKGGRTDNG